MDDQHAVGAGHVHAHAERDADRGQVAEEDEGHHDRQQRERGADLAAEQVAPDERQELHAEASVVSVPWETCSVRRARAAARASCVTMTIVLPCWALSACSRSRISSPDRRSRSPVGSSPQQQRRIRHDGARDADPLLLAARELPRIVLRAVLEAHDRERRRHVAPPVGAPQRREQQRQLDVLLRRQHRQQVVELEDEADVAGAPACQPPARQVIDAVPGDGDRALRRRVESAHQVQQGRLARPRGPHQGEEVALRDLDIDAPQHVDPLRSAPEHLVDVANVDERAIGRH